MIQKTIASLFSWIIVIKKYYFHKISLHQQHNKNFRENFKDLFIKIRRNFNFKKNDLVIDIGSTTE